MMRVLSLLLLLLLGPARAYGEDAAFAEPHMEFYRDLVITGLDDPEIAQNKALEALRREAFRDELWLQAYLYLLTNNADQLPPAWKGRESMEKAIHVAQDKAHISMELQLRYQLEALDLQEKNAGPDEWGKLHAKYLALAEEHQAWRFATVVSSAQSFNAYNSGDMKTALETTQRSIQRLQKILPLNDPQMLMLRLNSAMFLEYGSARDKALEIYRSLIEDLRPLNLRWCWGDAHFNYGLALMNSGRYAEAEKAFHVTESIGETLHSTLVQGRAWKGLAYAQQKMNNTRAAIASYHKAITMMEEGKEDPVAIADTYKLMAVCYNQEKMFAKALQAVDTAAKNQTAMMDKVWEKSLLQARIDAHLGLGNTSEALRATRRLNEVLIAYVEDEREKQMSKLKVSLGLELEEARNKLLTEQNHAQEEKLHNAEVFRRYFIGGMALCGLIIILLGFALRQTWKVKESRERVHRILEHIDEGILSIGAGMRVEADLSPYLTRLLPIKERSQDRADIFVQLLEAADLNADDRATMRAALGACLGETELTWEFNRPLLPLELTLQQGTRHLSFEWQPIFDEHRRIQNILVTVRDVTARHELQKEVADARARVSRLEQRLATILQVDARTAAAFMHEAGRILDQLRPHLNAGQDLARCYAQLHTLKGMARTVGFKEITALIHALENGIDLPQQRLLNPKEAQQLFAELEETIIAYQVIIEKVYLKEKGLQDRRPLSLADLVVHTLGPLRDMLEASELELSALDIQDHVAHWTRDELDVAQLLLLHGMTNTADHGFILPRKRGQDVSRNVAVTIRAARTEEALTLELSDNGVGIDWAKLRDMAQKLGFVPGAEETLADVVFVEGASSAEQVSLSSGRGMGLAALKQKVVSLNGRVHLKPNPAGQGSCLVAIIPVSSAKAA